jgi:hypothetical protein
MFRSVSSIFEGKVDEIAVASLHDFMLYFQAETDLLRTIIEESRNGQRFTCILYPTKDSMLLPDFIAAARRTGSSSDSSDNCSEGGSCCGNGGDRSSESSSESGRGLKPINMVVLDGTYSHARRQLRHLEAMLAQFNAREEEREMGRPVTLPVVKLLLGKDGEQQHGCLQCRDMTCTDLCVVLLIYLISLCLSLFVVMSICLYVVLLNCIVLYCAMLCFVQCMSQDAPRPSWVL